MIRAAVGFFVLALVAYIFGANGLAGLSMEVGKILVGVFIVLAVVFTVVSLITGKKTKILS
jgi:uncharacterized membrane protein YtjA (UPF0391 family)